MPDAGAEHSALNCSKSCSIGSGSAGNRDGKEAGYGAGDSARMAYNVVGDCDNGGAGFKGEYAGRSSVNSDDVGSFGLDKSYSANTDATAPISSVSAHNPPTVSGTAGASAAYV